MLRRLFPAIIAVTFPWALVGCPGFNHYRYDLPPAAAKDAEKWWADKVDTLDLDFLATLCAASDIHRQLGTTADYVFFFVGRTMAASYYHDWELPLPIPKTAEERAKIRLANWKPSGDEPAYRSRFRDWFWRGGKGCSSEKAEEIWREAEKKFGWKILEKNGEPGA